MAKKRERRAKGEGTIRLRADGRYEGRESPETVPPGERQRSVYGSSEREVIRKLRELRRDREQGLNFDAAGLTVGEYLERWTEGPLKGSVAKKTQRRLRAHVASAPDPRSGPPQASQADRRAPRRAVRQEAR